MDLNLKNKTALVTGASKGIGACIAETLASEGCNLIITSRSKADLEELSKTLIAKYKIDCTYFALDLSSRETILDLDAKIKTVDILINNAGAIPGGNMLDLSVETWRDSWDLKVWGYINLTKVFYEKMKTTGSGVIINIIGFAGEKLNPDYIAGTSANASLIAFTKAVGSNSLNDGIRVLGVNPGLIATDRIKRLDTYNDLSNDKKKASRLGTVNEIADAVVFLASERASYISGTVINVDGGLVSRN